MPQGSTPAGSTDRACDRGGQGLRTGPVAGVDRVLEACFACVGFGRLPPAALVGELWRPLHLLALGYAPLHDGADYSLLLL